MRKNRLLLVFMATVLIFPSFLVNATTNDRSKENNDALVLADGKITSKDEVVYATLSPTGETEEIYVVNILDVAKAGAIFDYGTYSNVKNLTDLSEIQQVNNTVHIEAPEGKFYYQGNLQNVELPWEIEVSYSLNGSKITPEILPGQDGQLQIHISTSANEKVNSVFYENYLLQISIELDLTKFSNIEAPDGTISNVGKNQQVTFTVLPEQLGDLFVEAQVSDFEMQGIEIAAVPSSMSIEVPETNMTDDMQSLSDAIQKLNDGVREFRSGIAELNDGVYSLRNGSGKFQEGIGELNQSSPKLIEASTTIHNSLSMISKSISENSQDMDLGELQQLPKGLSQIAGGLLQTADGLSLLNENYSVAYSTLGEAMNKIPDYSISEEEILALYASGADSATIDKLVETYSAALTAKGTYNAVKAGFDAVNTTLSEISTGVKEMGTTLATISKDLSLSLESMEMIDSFVQLEKGMKELSAGYGEFHSGLVDYTNGVSQLSNSYSSIHSGLVDLSKGTGELKTGAAELQEGTNKLYESTSNLPEQMQEEIDQMIADYDKSDFDAISFISPKNTKINSVQFVMKTEKIEKDEVDSSPIEEEDEMNFWSRLWALFK
ncbi:YhgE/Pip domain-containing protein [Alkalihalobacterium sp. APHAB7]|uniref:YhgE/Pip domain-containing protein n=1 Tax=Alkalihalobacterium sp. APHAB7 TaxID=3402081 RepID=UPI003AAD3695